MNITTENTLQTALEYLTQAKNIIDNDFERAIGLAKMALECAGNTSEIFINAHLVIIVALQRRGEYPQALELGLSILSRAVEFDDKHLIGRLHNNIGNIYFKMQQIDKALEHYKTTEYYSYLFNEHEKAVLRANIGMVLHRMGEFESAIQEYSIVLGIGPETQDKSLCTRALNNIGLSYAELEQYENALTYFTEAKSVSEEIGDILVLINSIGNMATVYAHWGNYENAIQFSLEAISLSEKNNEKDLVRQGLLSLSAVYEMAGKYPDALDAHKKHLAIYQEIMSERNHSLISELRTKYEAEKREQEKEVFRLKNIELAELNNKLDLLNREKDDIMGIAVHDLKNPIFSIRSCARMIHDNIHKMKTEEILEITEDIQRSSSMMLEIVSSLLDINRIESGKLEVTLAPLKVDDVIEYSYVTFANEASKKLIIISIIQEEPSLFVYADEFLLKQVLDNLISNSVKYSPENTTVTISAKSTENRKALITITDQGQGFTTDDMTKIFGKFQRLSAQPTAGEHSTGLGLSIVKKLVELMNGRIWCESEGRGKGSTFIIELDLANKPK